jgi:hypothetical protein
MALIWIDESELKKVQWFQALTYAEYRRVYQNKEPIKKFFDLRVAAIRNQILQKKDIKEDDIIAILKGLKLVEEQIIPVLLAMKEQIEEKDLQPVKTQYNKSTTTQ